LGFIRSKRLSKEIDSTAELFFIGGATLYTATFVLGNNWDYRLIFLILCAPYVVTTAQPQRYALMAATLISMNYWTFSYIAALLSNSSTKAQFIVTMFVQVGKCSLCALLLYELGQLVRRRLTTTASDRLYGTRAAASSVHAASVGALEVPDYRREQPL